MHFVVQRQLTDVSDCTKNNLPQLLTSIHKSQLMHGASPRDFVTLLQTCKAIYKVVTNVMEGIFFQVENVTTDSQEALFPPQAHGSNVGPIQKRFGAMVLFREAAGHMIQASTACTWMGSAMPNSSIGISSVIPRSEIRKVLTGEKVSGNIDDCEPNACGDGHCVDKVNGYTCNCDAGHELMLQENDSVCVAKECGTFPLSRMVQ